VEEQCRKRQQDRLRVERETIGDRVQREPAAICPLPASPYACDQASGTVTAQALMRYKTWGNRCGHRYLNSGVTLCGDKSV